MHEAFDVFFVVAHLLVLLDLERERVDLGLLPLGQLFFLVKRVLQRFQLQFFLLRLTLKRLYGFVFDFEHLLHVEQVFFQLLNLLLLGLKTGFHLLRAMR